MNALLFILLIGAVAIGFSLRASFLKRLRAQYPDVWRSLGSPGIILNNFSAKQLIDPQVHPEGRVLGAIALAQLRSAYVLLTRDILEFKYGRRVKRMQLADISAVHFRSGYIVVLKHPRKIGMMIPPVFKNSGDLLRRLKTNVLTIKAEIGAVSPSRPE